MVECGWRSHEASLLTFSFAIIGQTRIGYARSRSTSNQKLTVAHTWRHHRRQGTSGHVWQGRFRSPVVQDGDHLLVVLRYIEANPVRAAIVADPCESTWSSHRCHGAGHADPTLDAFPEWEQLGRTEPERRARWRRKVRGKQPAKELGTGNGNGTSPILLSQATFLLAYIANNGPVPLSVPPAFRPLAYIANNGPVPLSRPAFRFPSRFLVPAAIRRRLIDVDETDAR